MKTDEDLSAETMRFNSSNLHAAKHSARKGIGRSTRSGLLLTCQLADLLLLSLYVELLGLERCVALDQDVLAG